MAALPKSNAAARRLYSWWWDSHISPKNSKWLQENLADMDSKVEAMVRLIEEDADSFAKRAELFYKKRPELMKLMEEVYKAYRALAERYDHATGALHQAHKTMAAAFPNQFPLDFCEEIQCGSSAPEEGSSSSNTSPGLFNKYTGDDLTDVSSSSDATKIRKTYSSEEGRGTRGLNISEEGACSDYNSLRQEIASLQDENQHLKNQIESETLHANKAEIETQCLKEVFIEMESKQKEVLSQYQACAARVSNLEKEITQNQAELKRVNEELVKEVENLSIAKKQNLHLDKGNKSLKLEVNLLKRKAKELQEIISMKCDELDKLKKSLQEEQQRSKKAEMSSQNFQQLCADRQEEMRGLALKIQHGDELKNLREENGRLHEEKLSSALRIIKLQDEILSLTHSIRELEDDIEIHREEKEVFQHELSRLKQERSDLEQRYDKQMEDIQTFSNSLVTFHSMIKELKNRNHELKETIKKQDGEKVTHLQNIKNLEEMSTKNLELETSLRHANNELDTLREKMKTLENTCYHLHSRICVHQAEKALLVSHVEATSGDIEKLSKENTFLENSLCDMNAELDDLRGKLKRLEETCHLLHNEKSILLAEKDNLTCQVNLIATSLKTLESRYTELEAKHTNLEKEKDSTLVQVGQLCDLLGLDKEQNTLAQSSKTPFSKLADQVHFLLKEGQQREQELEMEQHKIMNAKIEIFILQRCLYDLKEKNLNISIRCQRHQDTLNCAEKCTSQLEKDCLIREENIRSLSEKNNKFREWIHLIIKLLKLDLEHASLVDMTDDLLIQLIMREIRNLLQNISTTQDEKQHLLLEKSIFLTLLEQFGACVTDLKSEKAATVEESKQRLEELAHLKAQNSEILDMNEQLRNKVLASKQNEALLKAEVDILFGQLSQLQEAHCSLQIRTSKLFEEKHLMSKKLCDITRRKNNLEEENNIIHAELLAMDCLTVILKSVTADRCIELQLISSQRDYLLKKKHELELDIQKASEKLARMEVDNTHIKESVASLEECRRNLLKVQDDLNTARSVCERLNLEIDTGKKPLKEKDGRYTQRNQGHDLCTEISAKPNHRMTNIQSQRKFNKTRLSCNEGMMVREEAEKSTSSLSADFANLETQNVRDEFVQCQTYMENSRTEDKNLISGLQKQMEAVRSSDAEITSLVNEVQFVTTNAALFKERIVDIIKTYESLENTMVKRKVLDKEIMLRNLTINELNEKLDTLEGENRELRADLNEYLFLLGSLWDDVTILEEHTFSLAKRHSYSQNGEHEDDQVGLLLQNKKDQETSGRYNGASPIGLLKLQDLHAKVKYLQKVVMDTGSNMELERISSNSSFEAEWQEFEALKLKDTTNSEICSVKDIQLDIVLNPSRHTGGRKTGNAEEVADRKLVLWGKSDGIYSNQKYKAPLALEANTEENYLLGEVTSASPSYEMVSEKELGIDKLELFEGVGSNQDWTRRVGNRLSSNAHRLLSLQDSVLVLLNNFKTSDKFDNLATLEPNIVKVQLKEAQGAVAKLIEINGKLTKKVYNLSQSPEHGDMERSDKKSRSQKLVSDRAQKVSERIERLEIEVQNIQHSLLKVEEENSSKRTKVVERRGLFLKEYIYGKKDNNRQKKGLCCTRPKASDD